jgi:uncharacterized membrane protein (DUF4010 family)
MNQAWGTAISGEALLSLAVALGVGLLIGVERERRKAQRGGEGAAGLRTFAIVALLGAISGLLGGVVLLALATLVVAGLAALSYWRTRKEADAGLTTEIALVLTALLGGAAVGAPALAAATGVAVAILLAARTPLHRFADEVLTERELRGALILAAATLIVLPVLPDRPVGPFEAINPRAVWLVVVLVLAIGAAGHVAVRALGARVGLPLAGLASGFVSSAATIGAMGARAAKTPAAAGPAASAAVLSTVATMVQMAVVLAAVDLATLAQVAPALAAGGLAAVAYGAAVTLRGLRESRDGREAGSGEAFSLRTALLFGATVAAVTLAAAALRVWFGDRGVLAAAAVGGFVDAHAAAISVAALVAAGRMSPEAAVLPILAGLTTNTVTKLVFAATAGSRGFAARVVPGLLLVAAASWAGALGWRALTG